LKSLKALFLQLQKQVLSLHAIHWLVIALSLSLTLFAWWYSKEQLEEKRQLQFDKQAEQIVRLVDDRMQKYEDALWAGVAYIHANDNHISYLKWKNYVEHLNILSKYPGINGIGVIFSVNKETLAPFLARQRQTRPNFKIHPAKERKHYLPITYIVPEKDNEKAVGLDMMFEKNRFHAALKAEKSGQAQMTGSIVLVQDQEKTPGFLLFAPFYSTEDLTNAKARQEHFLGLVYAPFIMSKLMNGTLAKAHRDLALKILDNHTILYNELVKTNSHFDPNALYKKELKVNIYGRTWTFMLWSSKSFIKNTSNNQAKTILMAGLIIDAMLLILFLQMTNARARALSYASRLSEDIKRESMAHFEVNKRLELALAASKIGVWEYDVNTQELIWDDAMFPLYGVDKNNFAGAYQVWEQTLHPDDKKSATALLRDSIEQAKKFDTSFRILLPNQEIRVIRALADVILENGQPKKMVGVNWDISSEKDKENQLEQLAKFDALSQLRNRFSFNEMSQKLLLRAQEVERKFALLLIDLDDFKKINDVFGHQVGDKFISLVSERFKHVCRNRDLIFRLGGDEFAILVDCFDEPTIAGDIAERVIEAMRIPCQIEGQSVKSSCSIGIAVYPHAGQNNDELMMNADIALYKSKKEGKDQINFFTDSLNKQAQRQRFIKNNLLSAARVGQVFMNYQPIVDARSQKTFAIEALARWESDIGLIPPDEFIYIAERDNHIHELGKIIIEQVLQDTKSIDPTIKLSINCSSKQLLENTNFAKQLLAELDAYQVAYQTIILEITETYLIRDFGFIQKTLTALDKQGIEVALDDFGTGYSSLSVLANIPFQYLKVDKSFVNNLDSPNGLKVLKSICNIAHSLGKDIIVEGVETKKQLNKLLSIGLRLMQGYYFAKPGKLRELNL
jgi:diguanylate cyclase (GGDEF)-like protein